MKEKSRFRVLVVDDNPAIHDDFRKMLQVDTEVSAKISDVKLNFLGEKAHEIKWPIFEIDSVYQGTEGIKLVQKALAKNKPYAIAIVDMRMPPGMDGIETVLKIWEIDPDIQIIFCTASNNYCWEDVIRRLGQPDRLLFLHKPFYTIEAIQLIYSLSKKWSLVKQVEEQFNILKKVVQDLTAELVVNIIKNKEKQFSELVESSPLGLLIQCEGKIVFVNNKLIKILGANKAEDIVNKSIYEFIHPDYHLIVKKRIQKLEKNRLKMMPWLKEKLLRLDGSVFYSDVTASSIEYFGKYGIQVMLTDVSEPNYFDDMTKLNQLWRTVFELTNDAIILFDENYIIHMFNPVVIERYGYDSNELKTMKIFELFSEESSDFFDVRMKKIIKEGGEVWETTHKKNNGELFLVEINCKPFRIGDKLQFISVIREIKKYDFSYIK